MTIRTDPPEAPRWVRVVLTTIVFAVLGAVLVAVVLALVRDKPYDLTPQHPQRGFYKLSPQPRS